MALTYNGAAFVFLLAGLLAAGLGVASYRHMDDRRGVPLTDDLVAAFHSEPVGLHGSGPRRGFFIALEGGEGAGKSTQARALAAWLESLGHDVLVTFEPGATEVGRRLRSVLLDHPEPVPGYDVPPPPALSARTEALLFAADRAEHVATVVRPALALGHVVISDRYTDSSVAYQGAGRDLAGAEVGRLSRWATDGLQPHLTVLLDLPAADGLARVEAPDRLESEPLAFHERVRDRFLELARRGGARYLVVDGTQPAALVTAAILARLEPVLPLSAQQLREAELAREAEEQRQRDRRGGPPAGGGPGPRRGRGAAPAGRPPRPRSGWRRQPRRPPRSPSSGGCRRRPPPPSGPGWPPSPRPRRRRPARSTPGCARCTPRSAASRRSEHRRAREAAHRHRRGSPAATSRPTTTRDPAAEPDRRAVRHRRRRATTTDEHRRRCPGPTTGATTGDASLPRPASGPTWSGSSRRSRCCAAAAAAAEAGRRGERRHRHDPRLAVHRAARAPAGRPPPGPSRPRCSARDGGCGECPACHTVLAGTHADVEVVNTRKLSIGVDDARALVSRAARYPSGGRWQVMVVEDADRLTDQAGNALLKAIEEPTPRTVWLLCAPAVEDVLPTIRSRCRHLSLRTPPTAAVAEVLVRRDGVDPAMAAFAARAAQGHIGRARRLATDEDARLRRHAVLRLPLSLGELSGALQAAGDLVDAATAEANEQAATLGDRRGRGDAPRPRASARAARQPAGAAAAAQGAGERAEGAGHPDQARRASTARWSTWPGSTATCWRCRPSADVELVNDEMRDAVTGIARASDARVDAAPHRRDPGRPHRDRRQRRRRCSRSRR